MLNLSAGPTTSAPRWWTSANDAQLAEDLFRVYQHLDEQDKPRQKANLHHLRLYGNLPSTESTPGRTIACLRTTGSR